MAVDATDDVLTGLTGAVHSYHNVYDIQEIRNSAKQTIEKVDVMLVRIKLEMDKKMLPEHGISDISVVNDQLRSTVEVLLEILDMAQRSIEEVTYVDKCSDKDIWIIAYEEAEKIFASGIFDKYLWGFLPKFVPLDEAKERHKIDFANLIFST